MLCYSCLTFAENWKAGILRTYEGIKYFDEDLSILGSDCVFLEEKFLTFRRIVVLLSLKAL